MPKAMELLLLGTAVGSREAASMGLVNRVCPDTEIDDEIARLTGELCAGPPVAFALTKTLMQRSFTVGLEEALEQEAASQSAAWGTADRREAFVAFAERRTPRFEGR